jgi:hypothetical protein
LRFCLSNESYNTKAIIIGIYNADVLCEAETKFLNITHNNFVFKRIKIPAYMIYWKCAKIRIELNYAHEWANKGKMSNARLTGNVCYHSNPKAVVITTTLSNKHSYKFCWPMDVVATQKR